MLKQETPNYDGLEISFPELLYQIRSMKVIHALTQQVNTWEGLELLSLESAVDDMSLPTFLTEASKVYVKEGTDGSVTLPKDTEIGKKLAKILDPHDPEPLPPYTHEEASKMGNAPFIEHLLEKSARYFRTGVQGLRGTDVVTFPKDGDYALLLPDFEDLALYFARKEDAEKFQASTDFPTRLAQYNSHYSQWFPVRKFKI